LIRRFLPEFAKRPIRRLRDALRRRRTLARLGETPPAAPERSGPLTIFFSPEAGIEPYFVAHCVAARTLAELGHPVLVARCFETFPYCPVMELLRVPYAPSAAQRRATCLDCAATWFRNASEYGLECLDLRPFLTPEILAEVRRAMDAAPRDLARFEFAGLPFGKLAMMDVALAEKIADFNAPDERPRAAWLRFIEASVTAYLLVDLICRRLSVARLVHFNDYSIMLGARLAAAKHGARVLSLTFAPHLNIDQRRYLIRDEPWCVACMPQEDRWPDFRDVPLPAPMVETIVDDLLSRFGGRGSHQFSPAKSTAAWDAHAALGLPRDARLLVAFTSSLDEATAIRRSREALGAPAYTGPNPFPDQIAWLRALIDVVEASGDLALVVRIHPREGVMRGRPSSQHLGRLREAFSGAYARCRFVWPEDKTSSYDLAEAADVALTAWTTMGVELARLGIPVLTAFRGVNPFPLEGFLEWAPTPDAYLAKVAARAARGEASLDRIAAAFRWYHQYVLANCIDLGDLVSGPSFGGLPPFRLPARADTLAKVVVEGRDVLDVNLERLRSARHAGSEAEERAALARGLRRVVHYVFTGEERSGDGALDLAVDGPRCAYRAAGRSYERYSPLVARIAPLCAQEGAS
jgi:hypothetical protein